MIAKNGNHILVLVDQLNLVQAAVVAMKHAKLRAMILLHAAHVHDAQYLNGQCGLKAAMHSNETRKVV